MDLVDADGFAATQIEGGLTLVCESGLVSWSSVSRCLLPMPVATFEAKLKGKFERLRAWVVFSVGSEYIIKGACAARRVRLPTWNDGAWEMGTLRAYWRPEGSKRPHLAELFEVDGAGVDPVAALAACQRLSRVRNRDVHTLNEGVRTRDHPLISEQFVPLLNAVLRTLPAESLAYDVLAKFAGACSAKLPRCQ